MLAVLLRSGFFFQNTLMGKVSKRNHFPENIVQYKAAGDPLAALEFNNRIYQDSRPGTTGAGTVVDI